MTYKLIPGEETSIELPGSVVLEPPPAATLNPSRGPRGPRGLPGPPGTVLLILEDEEPLPPNINDKSLIVRLPEF